MFIFYVETHISTGTEEQHDFDIVEKVEMVSERRCDVHLIRIGYFILVLSKKNT